VTLIKYHDQRRNTPAIKKLSQLNCVILEIWWLLHLFLPRSSFSIHLDFVKETKNSISDFISVFVIKKPIFKNLKQVYFNKFLIKKWVFIVKKYFYYFFNLIFFNTYFRTILE